MKPVFTLLFCCAFYLAIGQTNYTISGYITDGDTGETLIAANVVPLEAINKGIVSNAYGFYSLSLPEGQYTLRFSYIGYQDQDQTIDLKEDIRLNIKLSQGVELIEVVVTAEEADRNVQDTKMGTLDLPVENIKKLPAIFGEVDVLKTLQLLPGVLSAGEGNAGFYVRGGGPDQNLVLLDEAVVYNPGHLLGFFSVFNADAIKNTTLIKGNMPASYGGRLSSVVDIQMKEGDDQNYRIEGGIGAIASRLTVQGPIVKNKSSFIVSARRTYVLDLAQPFLEGSDFEGTNYYFYDVNAKVNYRFSDKDRLYLSTYFGRDVLQFRSPVRDFNFDLPYGNATATLRWNHLFSDKLFMNVSAIFNEYDFGFSGGQAEFSVDVFSGVRDWNGKVDFDYFINPAHSLKFGLNYTYHRLTPNVATASDGNTTFSNELEAKFAHESAAYIQDDWKVNDRLKMNVGVRFSMFTQLGPYVSPFDGQKFEQGEPVKTYTGIEPRLSLRYRLDPTTSIKAGAALSNQYLHLVSNSTSTLPADVWVPSTERIKPQIGLQYAVGLFKNFEDNTYETSLEVYYKDLRNQVDYRENYVNNPANDIENEFVFGTGEAYGAELFLKKAKGRLNGWVGYTWSRTTRSFPDINNGESFPAIYDRTHDLSVVLNYDLSPKWDLGAIFVFGTGNTFTPVQSLFFIEQNFVPEYGTRNSARVDDYHRFDLSATYTPKPNSTKRFTSNWTFSVYNAYNRQNPFFIYYTFETDAAQGDGRATAFKVSLFPVIPSITWNFKWRS
ncbi:MAG: TonB-dependent receptor [Bacteroidota bacterium]